MITDILQKIFFAFYITDGKKQGAFRLIYTFIAMGFFAQLLIISITILAESVLGKPVTHNLSTTLLFILLETLTFGCIYGACLKNITLEQLIDKQTKYMTIKKAERIKIAYALSCFLSFIIAVWFGF